VFVGLGLESKLHGLPKLFDTCDIMGLCFVWEVASAI